MSFQAIERLVPASARAGFRRFAKRVNTHWLGGNRLSIAGSGNRLALADAILKRTRISITGDNNLIEIGADCRLRDASIIIRGNGHHVVIGGACSITAAIELVGGRCRVAIGERTTIIAAFIAAFEEGTAVTFGTDCMLSSGIDIRTGDSHGIIDSEGLRLNLARDVQLGDHVWIGRGVSVLKGVTIGANCVVGACAVVTKDLPPCSLAAGIPARILREGVNWVRDLRDLPPPPLPPRA